MASEKIREKGFPESRCDCEGWNTSKSTLLIANLEPEWEENIGIMVILKMQKEYVHPVCVCLSPVWGVCVVCEGQCESTAHTSGPSAVQ